MLVYILWRVSQTQAKPDKRSKDFAIQNDSVPAGGFGGRTPSAKQGLHEYSDMNAPDRSVSLEA